MLGRLMLLIALAVATTAAATAQGEDSFDPDAPAPLTIEPRVGGQGTTFTLAFRSPGIDTGPDDDGEVLVVRGPRGTACAGRLLGDLIASFGAGPARFSFGPRSPRPRFGANAQAFRPVRRWCPGRYSGRVDRLNQSAPGGSRTFTFRVRATAGGPPGRRLPPGTDPDVERLPPRNPPWLRVRQRPGPERVVQLDVRIGGRGEQPFDFGLRPPFPCDDDEQLLSAYLVFRPGAARVLVGGRGPRVLGRNTRRVPVARALCRGRWIGSFGSRSFRFTVR